MHVTTDDLIIAPQNPDDRGEHGSELEKRTRDFGQPFHRSEFSNFATKYENGGLTWFVSRV